MSPRQRPILAGLKEQVSGFRTDVVAFASLRWKLVSLEVRAAIGHVKWLSIGLVGAAVVMLTGLSTLVVSIALLLDDAWLPAWGWALFFGLLLFFGGILGGLALWIRFRRRFTGLEQTLEEIREDIVWLKDWISRDGNATDSDGTNEDAAKANAAGEGEETSCDDASDQERAEGEARASNDG